MSLIFSPSFVLALPTGYDSTFPVIGWESQVVVTGVHADFEEDNFPATNLANPATNLLWRSTSTATQYVTFDLNEEEPVDYIGIARHNLGSGGIVISVEVQTYDSADWVEFIEGFVVADDAPILIRFLENIAGAMRLKLVPLAAVPEIGVVFIGRMLVMPTGIAFGHTPLVDGRVTRTVAGNSEAGDYLGSIVLSQKLASSVSFRYIEDAWYRQNMRPFAKQGRGTPFFWSGFPDSHPGEAGYAWLTSDPQPDFIEAGWVNITLEMGGIIS
jgi:hypothetical protein